ncbi:MAG: O-antigen ligase family protein [Anaerolineaceae bacterium]|nr:O-antigen ligase family protein [Anaerolineaceae bacterium]
MKITAQWSYLIKESILILLFAFWIFVSGSQHALINIPILIIQAILMAAFLIWRILRGRFQDRKLDMAVFGFLAVLILTSFTSIDPRRSLQETWLIALAFFIFYVIAEWVQHGWPAELIVKCLLIVGAVFMLLSWMEAFGWYLNWRAVNPGEWLPDSVYRLPSPNFICVMLNTWLMLALVRLIVSRNWINRVMLGLWILSALGLIYLSSSRGGWLGTMAGFGFLILYSLYMYRNKWLLAWRWLLARRVLFIIIAFVSIVLVSGAGYVLYQQTMHPSHGAILTARTGFWVPAWNAFLSKPLLGTGAHTFISHYLQSRSIPPDFYYDYAHNIYLDLLSGSGLLGLIAFAGLLLVVLKLVWQQIQAHQKNPVELSVIVGAAGALAAFLGHGLFDSVHHTVPVSLWNLAIILGAALGSKKMGEVKAAKPIKALQITWQVLVVLGFGLLIWVLQPMQAGTQAAQHAEWELAVNQFEIAVQRDPYSAIVHQQLGLARSLRAESEGQSSESLDGAISAFESCTQIDPWWSANWVNLGALYLQNGELEKAGTAFERALQAAPKDAIARLNLGIAQEMQKEPKAKETYQQVLKQNPQWVDTEFWQQTDLRADLVKDNELTKPDYGQLAPYLAQIQAHLDAGELIAAHEVIFASKDVYRQVGEGALEKAWLSIQLTALEGDIDLACEQSLTFYETRFEQGIFGLGSLGNQGYSIFHFRSPPMGVDYAPQVNVVGMGRNWEERRALVEGWCE